MPRLPKIAMLVVEPTSTSYGGFDNLALTAQELKADQIATKNVDINNLEKYQCVIVVDNVNYNVYKDLCIQIREKYPKMLIGWHQEKEVDNIFRRHKCHGDMTSSEESWCVDSLKIWNNLKACNFVLLHNSDDMSVNFYRVFAPWLTPIVSGPFLPVDLISGMAKPREEKRKWIAFGHDYGWREGGFLGYVIASSFVDFDLWRWHYGPYDSGQLTLDTIMLKEFFQRHVDVHLPGGCRKALAKFFADCYVVINLREPTSGRTNAIAAAVGTPMIGNAANTTQRILFPKLRVNKYNLLGAKTLLSELVSSSIYYDECIVYAKDRLHQVSVEYCGQHLRNEIERLYEIQN